MRVAFVALILMLGAARAAEPDPAWPGPVHDVRRFGAMGDGAAYDTPAIQWAIDALPPSGGTVLFPRGTYRVENLRIADRGHVRVLGRDATLRIEGAARAPAYVGLQLHGELFGVRIEGLTIVGDGRVTSRHAGVWMTTAPHVMRDVTVRDCRIRDVVNGIRFDNTGGKLSGLRIEGNRVENVVGIDPGEGYGIVHSNGGTVPGAAVIAGNAVIRAQRHGIYQSAGSGDTIRDNEILDHRKGLDDGRSRAAICIARSRDITVESNRILRCAGGGVSVDPDESDAASVSGRIAIRKNRFVESHGRDIWVGAEVVTPTTGRLDGVEIADNAVIRPADPSVQTESIRVVDGSHIAILNNTFELTTPHPAEYTFIIATARPDSRLDEVRIEGNSAHGPEGGAPLSLVALGDSLLRGHQHVTVLGPDESKNGGPALLRAGPTPTNPNLRVETVAAGTPR